VGKDLKAKLDQMSTVQIDMVTSADWAQLVGSEAEPWGAVGETLAWCEKDQHVTSRDADGRLRGVAGSALVDVQIAAREPFKVLGIGGVFVRADQRGRGLARELLERLLESGREREADRAMLFCRDPLMALYEKFGFQAIEDSVWADQPGGRTEMPLRAMWLGFERDMSWPAGRVDVLGLPF
jgi:predicted GNAT family N-acyltransferase